MTTKPKNKLTPGETPYNHLDVLGGVEMKAFVPDASRHVCGVSGWNPELDGSCPGCTTRTNSSAASADERGWSEQVKLMDRLRDVAALRDREYLRWRDLQSKYAELEARHSRLSAAVREFKRMVMTHSDATVSPFWTLMEDKLDAALASTSQNTNESEDKS